MNSNIVPIVDFRSYNLESNSVPHREEIKTLSDALYNAFRNIGFVYLKNHGISQELIDRAFKTSAEFFKLPETTKDQFSRPVGLRNHGWCKLEREKVNPDRPNDYKEAFDVNPLQGKTWPPDNLVDGFQDSLESMYRCCRQLSSRILELMAIGLDLKDPKYFVERHNPTRPTYTALRSLYYPAITNVTDLQQNQLRCGEHTDYGSMTILFQDDAGGLEVFSREENAYVPAPAIEGAVLVNLGDLMQRWTADQFISTKHRVVNPDIIGTNSRSRQSIVCFIHPDEDCMVECIDGSNKYPTVSAKHYIDRRFKETEI